MLGPPDKDGVLQSRSSVAGGGVGTTRGLVTVITAKSRESRSLRYGTRHRFLDVLRGGNVLSNCLFFRSLTQRKRTWYVCQSVGLQPPPALQPTHETSCLASCLFSESSRLQSPSSNVNCELKLPRPVYTAHEHVAAGIDASPCVSRAEC